MNNESPEQISRYSGWGDVFTATGFIKDLRRWAKKLEEKAAALSAEGSAKKEKSKTAKDRFEIGPGQVLFDGKDLNLPSGEPVEVCKKLIENFGRVVVYKTLNEYYSSATPGTLPRTITKIRQSFKTNKVPCQVQNKTNEGYFIQATTLRRPRQERVRKRQ